MLGAFLLSRLVCALFVYLGHGRRPFLSPVAGGWEGVANWWLNPWTTYDSTWYLQIAANGYQEHTTAFFPLYPWLLGLAGDDPVRMALFGVGLSHGALLGALWLVFHLTELEWGEKHAHLTVWLLAFTPAAAFFGAVYTESLFLALLAATFLAVRQQRWWWAGLFGMLAALLRNPGVLIACALLLEAWEQRAESRSGQWVAWFFPLGAFLVVQTWFWRTFDGPMAGIASQAYFHRQPAWPWSPLIGDIQALLTPGHGLAFSLLAATALTASIAGLVLPVCGRRRFRCSYLLLIGGITLMNLGLMRQIPPHTAAAVRYMGGLFPVSQILAWYLLERLGRWPRARMLVVGGQLYLFAVFSYLFGLKQFLG